MFGLFKSSKPKKPLNQERREYYEQNMSWLSHAFPEPPLDKRIILTPTEEHFPIKWDGSENMAKEVLRTVAGHMNVDHDRINLHFFDTGVTQVDGGSYPMFLEHQDDSFNAYGVYFQENEDGTSDIGLNRDLLNEPDNLIATFAHELAHEKLLGELKLKVNDEFLTDLATVFFGFGIFNANTSFRFNQDYEKWAYASAGYLSQDEWSYCLALLAFMRYEDNPDWAQHLNATIRKEFHKNLEYLLENEDDIFKLDENENQSENNTAQQQP